VTGTLPDSGTDQLTGVTGNLIIRIADGKHSTNSNTNLPGRALPFKADLFALVSQRGGARASV
jgi:hypothetical protein